MTRAVVVITEEEWQALHLASHALRDVGAGLRRPGAEELALESVRNADVLEALGRRAIVAAGCDNTAELEPGR
jgi:hypothetical protein